MTTRVEEILSRHLTILDRAVAAVVASGVSVDDLWLAQIENTTHVVSSPGRDPDPQLRVAHAVLTLVFASDADGRPEIRLDYSGPHISLEKES